MDKSKEANTHEQHAIWIIWNKANIYKTDKLDTYKIAFDIWSPKCASWIFSVWILLCISKF